MSRLVSSTRSRTPPQLLCAVRHLHHMRTSARAKVHRGPELTRRHLFDQRVRRGHLLCLRGSACSVNGKRCQRAGGSVHSGRATTDDSRTLESDAHHMPEARGLPSFFISLAHHYRGLEVPLLPYQLHKSRPYRGTTRALSSPHSSFLTMMTKRTSVDLNATSFFFGNRLSFGEAQAKRVGFQSCRTKPVR